MTDPTLECFRESLPNGVRQRYSSAMSRAEEAGVAGKWHDALLRMRKDLEAGRWKPGEKLPPSPELCARLGLTQPTLRKVMRRLVEAGMVEPLTRGWKARGARTAAGSLRIALIRRCDEDGVSVGEAAREAFFRRALEQEAARVHMRIETWGASESGRLFHDGEPFEGELAERAEGIVLSLWRIENDEQVFRRVAGTRIPIAVWDERPQGGRRPSFNRCRWFVSGYSPGAGRDIARYLLDLGHRGIAFLSPYHGSSWSQKRLEGIRSVCDAAIPGASVRVFSWDGAWNPSQYNPDPSLVRRLVAPIGEELGKLLPDRFATIAESVEAALRDRSVLADVERLCAGALADRTLTAWVAANDDIALLASAWLRSRGIAPGRDVSIAGFDNTPRAQEAGLTSFGFAEEELAVAMLAYLAAPSRWKSNGSVVVDGSLVARQSTRPPAT